VTITAVPWNVFIASMLVVTRRVSSVATLTQLTFALDIRLVCVIIACHVPAISSIPSIIAAIDIVYYY
jgi:hypothetical protein